MDVVPQNAAFLEGRDMQHWAVDVVHRGVNPAHALQSTLCSLSMTKALGAVTLNSQ